MATGLRIICSNFIRQFPAAKLKNTVAGNNILVAAVESTTAAAVITAQILLTRSNVFVIFPQFIISILSSPAPCKQRKA